MHELSFVCGLIRLVEGSAAAHGLRRVHRVLVHVGDRSCVSQEALVFAFGALAQGALWSGARLDLQTVPESSQVLVAEYEGQDDGP